MTTRTLIIFTILCAMPLTLNAEETQRAPASYKLPKLQKASETLAPPPAISTDEAPSGEEDEFGWTGDWSGARTRLAEKGFTAALVYKGEWARVLKGGNETHTMHLNNIDLKLNIDAEKAFGWNGTSFFFYGISNTGADTGNTPTSYAGDRQGTSNIETGTNDTKLYEA